MPSASRSLAHAPAGASTASKVRYRGETWNFHQTDSCSQSVIGRAATWSETSLPPDTGIPLLKPCGHCRITDESSNRPRLGLSASHLFPLKVSNCIVRVRHNRWSPNIQPRHSRRLGLRKPVSALAARWKVIRALNRSVVQPKRRHADLLQVF
jgi:hypothetical protein